ncbi:AraC family transcriptional regulator [Thalassospira marina]|uniref:AraC family transcriptional regulator n=1 Tax=Thalassospira marina TaxID=2048283 RepID=A0A2N3KT86_9PROT|nr:AraC family transcriptional regulator [Thalassospira marina]PKR53762.1 AraC family transcriptional regulator [Thalassospira marina]
MDPLSDVLALLKPKSYVSAGFDAGGDWAIRFNNLRDRIKCYAVISGNAWLRVDDMPGPVFLNKGDCFVLPSGRSFELASDPAISPVSSSTLFPPPRDGSVITHNGGGDFFIVGSRFGVSGGGASTIMKMLPPIVHIKHESDRAALRFAVERMMQELHDEQPGSFLIAQHLAHMMLVQALRLHLGEMGKGGVGWFSALADKNLALAIYAMHAQPDRRWTLLELAEHAGMSRSIFAQKFKEKVGESPIEYLTRWRMLLAGDRLENSTDPVSVIALSVGYETESSFSTAFKRVMGSSPRQYIGRPALDAMTTG